MTDILLKMGATAGAAIVCGWSMVASPLAQADPGAAISLIEMVGKGGLYVGAGLFIVGAWRGDFVWRWVYQAMIDDRNFWRSMWEKDRVESQRKIDSLIESNLKLASGLRMTADAAGKATSVLEKTMQAGGGGEGSK